MQGRVELTDDTDPALRRRARGRHRGPGRLPGPLVLGLAVAALLLAFGVGVALLPSGITGTGRSAAPAGGTPVGTAQPDAAADTGGPTDEPEAQAGTGQRPTPASSRSEPTPDRTPADASTTPSRRRDEPRPTRRPPESSGGAAASGVDTREDEVTELVNAERSAAGCGAVRTDERLRRAARGHSADMAENDYFDHQGRDGSRFTDRAENAGYDAAIGENIAFGQRTPAEVMESWMNSPGHRRNILNCDAAAIGVGVASDGGRLYWTQVFGAV